MCRTACGTKSGLFHLKKAPTVVISAQRYVWSGILIAQIRLSRVQISIHSFIAQLAPVVVSWCVPSSCTLKPMSDYRYLSADIVGRFFSSEKNRPIEHVTLHKCAKNVNGWLIISSADKENAAAAVLALLLGRRRRDMTHHDSKFSVKLPCK